MKRSNVLTAIFSLVILFAGAGCDSGSSEESDEPAIQISVDLDGMAHLDDAFQYRIWARVDLEWIQSSQGFNFDESGRLTNTTNQLISNTFLMQQDISGAEIVLIAIHGKAITRHEGEAPETVVLAGEAVSGSVTLSVSHDLALGPNILSASGSYTVLTLETPADAPQNYPKEAGIWFGEPDGAGSLLPTLTIPHLPSGWIYAGWVEKDSKTYAIGRFEEASGTDMNNKYSQVEVLTPVPGENFLTNAPSGSTFPLDVRGATVFVTVEPVPDDSPEFPTTFRLFEAEVPASATAESTFPLTQQGGLPSGTATIF